MVGLEASTAPGNHAATAAARPETHWGALGAAAAPAAVNQIPENWPKSQTPRLSRVCIRPQPAPRIDRREKQRLAAFARSRNSWPFNAKRKPRLSLQAGFPLTEGSAISRVTFYMAPHLGARYKRSLCTDIDYTHGAEIYGTLRAEVKNCRPLLSALGLQLRGGAGFANQITVREVPPPAVTARQKKVASTPQRKWLRWRPVAPGMARITPYP